MPPKRDIYINIMDPVEKQTIKEVSKENKKCSCKCFFCVTFCLGIIGSSGILGYLYYNNDLDLTNL